LFVLPGGAFGDVSVNDAAGFVFSSVQLPKNYERAVESWGPKVPGSNDATFKLCVGGWPISVYGVLHVYYSDDKEISTQFRPVAYMLHSSESEKSITKLLECAKAAVLLVSGVHIQHSTGCTNRAVDVVPPYIVKNASLLQAGDVGELSPVPADVKQRVFYVNTKKFAASPEARRWTLRVLKTTTPLWMRCKSNALQVWALCKLSSRSSCPCIACTSTETCTLCRARYLLVVLRVHGGATAKDFGARRCARTC